MSAKSRKSTGRICDVLYSEKADVDIHVTPAVLEEIIQHRLTFQGAFMAGNMRMKGDFKQLRMLDILFKFGN